MSVIEVSLAEVFQKKDLLPCCPRCKSTDLKNSSKAPNWKCLKGCGWRGNYPAMKINGKEYNVVLERILQQAQIQKNIVVMALDKGVILPVELTEGV